MFNVRKKQRSCETILIEELYIYIHIQEEKQKTKIAYCKRCKACGAYKAKISL